MTSKVRCILISLFIIITATKAQTKEPSYTLTLMKAKFLDTTNHKQILLIFKHQSKSRRIEKLIISGKLTFSLDDDANDVTEILGQGENHHQITVLGNDIESKDKYIFGLVKDNPNFSTEPETRFLVFRLVNLTAKYVDHMTFTYGLWEPDDSKIRIETKYQIPIEK